MEEKSGKLFVNSPNALEGNEISKCDTSSAKYQSEEAGLVDVLGSEEEILAQMRLLISVCCLPTTKTILPMKTALMI